MTNEERTKASKEQILRYLFSYYPQWRAVKILSVKKILEHKYEFFKDIIAPLKQPDDITGEATIAQEITNGLLFSALSECLQYIEDLFLLMKFSENLDWFAKNVVTYSAGEITNFVESYKTTSQSLCRSFLFPLVPDSEWPNDETKNAYKDGLDCLKGYVENIISFFNEHKFFYNQYKHGLTIALRPFALFDQKMIDERRLTPTTGYPVAFDNLSIDKIFRQSDRFKQLLMIPSLSPYVRANLGDLQKEDNLLRFVPYHKGEITVEEILDCTMKVRSAMVTLTNNLAAMAQGGSLSLRLPKGDVWLSFEFNESPSGS